MITVSEFAKTHNITTKDVLELARDLGFPLKESTDLLSDDARTSLMTSLNQHVKRLGLNDIKSQTVSSVIGGDRNVIKVVTKRRDFKPFDVQALKNKIRTEKKQEVEMAEPVENLHESEKVIDAEQVFSSKDTIQDVPVQPLMDEMPLLSLEGANSVATESVENANPSSIDLAKPQKVNNDKAVLIKDDEDARATKLKSKKKKHVQGTIDSSKLDNSMLRRFATQFQADELNDDDQGNNNRNKRVKKDKKNLHKFNRPVKPVQLIVQVPEQILVSDLALQLSVKLIIVIKELLKLGLVAQGNTIIDRDVATLVIEELGHIAQPLTEKSPEDILTISYTGEQKSRSPIVTIMGHVDHGKTSLLDYIRRSRVAASEAGGITQHIGAYSVKTGHGNVTFLDTPGHAAFTAMRARGAQCTDIAVIIVAADDGVMPQTREAIAHAKAAGVPIVVAMNKIDKESSDIERIKTQMAQLDVLPEEWGGDSPFIPVSAKTGFGVDHLLEILSLQAEILELKAHYEGPAQGTIVESSLSRLRGPVATVLVQQGTLKVGDLVVCGTEYGRIRALSDDLGSSLIEATPSMPVEILGLSGVVDAGDALVVVENEKQARDIIEHRLVAQRPAHQPAVSMSLENFFSQNQKSKELCVILKADTHGSAEAIVDSLKKMATEEVALKIIAQGVGGINESDIMLAKASSAIVLAFNTRAERTAKSIAEQEHVAIYYFSIIYELLDKVKAAVYGLESPKFQEEFVGLAEVRSVFRSSHLGNIAGCLVTDGHVRKDLPIRVLRQNVVIYQGKLESLRRYKDDVMEVRAGTDCGIGIKDYNDVKEGDQIEVYRMIELQRKH
jgi:translation initiation factor IF-2